MELWVRSQDKEKLLLVKELYVFCNEPMTNKTYKIVNNCNENLGVYKSKERTLEVLDEIQNLLKPPMIIQKTEGVIATTDNTMHIINPTYGEIKQLSTIVYEMPKE